MIRLVAALVYRFLQGLGWLVRLLPFGIRKGMARVGAVLWFDFVGFRRRVILLNLVHAFPRRPEEASVDFQRRITRLARENLYHYFLGIFEVMEKTTLNERALNDRLEFRGLEHLRKASQAGQGVFLLGAHIGNWEVELALSRLVGIPLSCIVRYVRNSFWDEILRRSRERFEVQLLPEESSGISVVKAFKKGHMVAFVFDQHTGEPHGVLARFFGLKAWTSKGLAILSLRLNAKILPAFSHREGRKIIIDIEAPISFDDLGDGSSDAQLLAHVQRCNDKIEEYVRRHPEQYFWIHRRFKASIDYKQERLPFPGS